MKVGQLLDFVNSGGNVVVVANSEISEPFRDFSIEFSIDFDDQNTHVVDPFHRQDSSIVVDQWIPNEYVISGKVNPILYRGLAHKFSGKNPLVFPLMTGYPSTYSYSMSDSTGTIEGNPLLGQDVGLISLFQGRNNARVAFCGSTDMFSDE